MPTPEKRHERHAKKIKLSFVLLTALFVLVLVGFSWVIIDIRNVSRQTAQLSERTAKLSAATAHLTFENTKRIAEIQSSRTASCRQTYRGVRNVFRPFFPKRPKDPNQARTRKFNETINVLIAGCESQTKSKSGG